MDENKEQFAAYQLKLNDMNLHELVKEFISYLDYTEESDSGREFHPIVVSSCRVMMTEPLGEVLNRLRKAVDIL